VDHNLTSWSLHKLVEGLDQSISSITGVFYTDSYSFVPILIKIYNFNCRTLGLDFMYVKIVVSVHFHCQYLIIIYFYSCVNDIHWEPSTPSVQRECSWIISWIINYITHDLKSPNPQPDFPMGSWERPIIIIPHYSDFQKKL